MSYRPASLDDVTSWLKKIHDLLDERLPKPAKASPSAAPKIDDGVCECGHSAPDHKTAKGMLGACFKCECAWFEGRVVE